MTEVPKFAYSHALRRDALMAAPTVLGLIALFGTLYYSCSPQEMQASGEPASGATGADRHSIERIINALCEGNPDASYVGRYMFEELNCLVPDLDHAQLLSNGDTECSLADTAHREQGLIRLYAQTRTHGDDVYQVVRRLDRLASPTPENETQEEGLLDVAIHYRDNEPVFCSIAFQYKLHGTPQLYDSLTRMRGPLVIGGILELTSSGTRWRQLQMTAHQEPVSLELMWDSQMGPWSELKPQPLESEEFADLHDLLVAFRRNA